MFGLFNIPRVSYRYYRPTIYRQRYDPIESYLLNTIKRVEEYEKLKALYHKTLIQQQQKQKQEEGKEEIKCDQDQSDIITQNSEPRSNPFYYFESHSKFDGQKLVEERKEQKYDSEGKLHQSLKRRLGDQWYQSEQIQDKDGKTVVKETWHNVSEEEVEQFKQEWLNKSGYKPKLTIAKNESETVDSEIPENEETETKSNENKDAEPEMPENEEIETKSNESKTVDSEIPENEKTETKSNENKDAEPEMPENEETETKSNENKDADFEIPENEETETKSNESKTVDSEIPENEEIETESNENKNAESEIQENEKLGIENDEIEKDIESKSDQVENEDKNQNPEDLQIATSEVEIKTE